MPVIDPSIIGNVMAVPAPRLPDINAMAQQQTTGMENIYKLERQRQADAAAAQKAQQEETLKALAPAIASVFSDSSDAGIDAALGIVPPQFREAAKAQLDQLRAIPDVGQRKNVVRSALMQDEYGRSLIAQFEPTAAQRANIDIQRQQLALRQAELDQSRKGAAAGEFATVETDQGIFILNKKTGEIKPATTEGLPGPRAGAEGPIAVGPPPQVLQAPAKKTETAEEVKKRLAEEKRGKDVAFAVKEVEAAAKPGGLIDQATGSYIGNLVDTAAQAFGVGTYGAVANAQMKPVADLVLKLVPRFEGPQSDKDTQSYKDAAGDLANPNLPASVKKAAATQIVGLLKKYNGQFEYSGNAGSAGGGVIDFNDLGD